MSKKIRNLINKRFTFMVVPTGSGNPRQFSLHISVIALIIFGWTSVTFLGSYLSAQHIDYWRTQLSNKILKIKVQYLVNQIENSRGYMDEVKQIDANLRQMLRLNSDAMDASITKPKKNSNATGGPSLAEQNEVTEILKEATLEYSWTDLLDKVVSFKFETRNRIHSFDKLSNWLKEQRRLYKAIPQGWPCPGHRTSHFGKRVDPFKKVEMFHFGVDIGGPVGTPIRATADGEVRISKWQSGYGKLVVLNHSYGYSTRYAHNSKLLVRVGDKVKRGQIIGLMGETGKASGPHCHYEVWKNNQRMNPYTYMIGESPQINALSRLPEDQWLLKPLEEDNNSAGNDPADL